MSPSSATDAGQSNLPPPVLDRHLKKIYDCLNIGSNKKAVQEADRLPKNVKCLTCVKALKALALLRMCKDEMAHNLFKEIDIKSDLDDVTLQTMTTFYKESHQVEKIIDIYEAACRRNPNDPELNANLFMSYVRVGNYKKQKEVALHMYKNFPLKKRICSFWAVMSLVMQASVEENEDQKRVCLTFAEKMCEKMLDDERSQEEIELYLLILKRQQKFDEEYKTLTGPLCNRLPDHLSWFNRRRAFLCIDLKMYSRAFKHYFPTLISEYPDQLEYYQALLQAALLIDLEHAKQTVSPSSIPVANQQSSLSSTTSTKSVPALVECLDIIEKQCAITQDATISESPNQVSQSSSISKRRNPLSSKNSPATALPNANQSRKSIRGPFIARLEFWQTILAYKEQLPDIVFKQCQDAFNSRHPCIESLILDYFQSFSRKIVFHFDIEYLLSKCNGYIDKDKMMNLIGNWVKNLEDSDDTLSDIDRYYIRLNHHILQYSITLNNQISEKDTLKLYLGYYNSGLKLSIDSHTTEFLPSDYYAMLIANSFMKRNELKAQQIPIQNILTDSQLFSLIVLVNSAISNSPGNHQLKLIALKLYNFIGAAKVSSFMLEKLDIKHFQIDTLGHLLNPILYYSGHFSLSQTSLSTCLKFYSVGIRDCLDGLVTSFKDRRYSKIEELTRIKTRLENSLNNLQCLLLNSVLQLVNVTTFEELQKYSQTLNGFYLKHLDLLRSNRIANAKSLEKLKNLVSDNRDFKVLKSFNAQVDEHMKASKQNSFEEEIVWMQLRYNVLESIATCYNIYALSHSKTANSSISLPNSQKKSIDELRKELKQCSAALTSTCELILSKSNAWKEERNEYSFLQPEFTPLTWSTLNLKAHLNLLQASVEYCLSGSFNQELEDKYSNNLEAIISNLEEQIVTLTTSGHVIDAHLFSKLKYLTCSIVQTLETISLSVSCLIYLTPFKQHQEVVVDSSATSNSGDSNNSGNKLRTSKQQLISKTDVTLTKLTCIIKSSIDYKKLINQCKIEPDFVVANGTAQTVDEVNQKTKLGHSLHTLTNSEMSQAYAKEIKEKLLDCFAESVKQIEDVCRRKAKLLRSKEIF